MKKITLISILLFTGFSIKVSAQCEFAKAKTAQSKFDPYDIPIDKMTLSYLLLQDKNAIATFELAKNENGNYLVLQYKRNGGKRFSILKDNSLDFIFDNGEKLQLYPIKNYPSYNNGLNSSYLMECIYKIDNEKLLSLTNNYPAIISLHYSAEVELKKSHIDEDGRFSFDHDISKYELRKNTTIISRCILNN